MNETKQIIINNWDIFILGVVCGGVFLSLMQHLEKVLTLRLNKKQMELDLTLGKALMDMKEKLK